MQDIAGFLGIHPPFDSLGTEELARLAATTVERLRAAEAAGILESRDARTLMEAFGFIFSLRLDHQVEQLRRGEVPDDFIDPKTLNPLAHSVGLNHRHRTERSREAP